MQAKASSRKRSKRLIADDDILTVEQKKDLSDTIGRLDGLKHEKVIQIIHEGVPEIRDVSLLVLAYVRSLTAFCRARRILSSKLTSCRLKSSRSSTTSSFGP